MTAVAAAALSSTAINPLPLAAQTTTRVRIDNNSDYAIYEVFLSPVSSPDWGFDLLDIDQVLAPNYQATLPPKHVGYYDLKLVDEDGDACVVSNVYVTPTTDWSINNSWLLGCEFDR